MAEPSLDCAGIMPVVGEGIAAGMAKHVRVGLQFETQPSACRPLNHPRKPAVVNGVPRSLTKTKGDGGLSRCRRRKARRSSPRSGCVLGVPFLTRRTWSTAPLKSTWSQRRTWERREIARRRMSVSCALCYGSQPS